ncbi:MAG TPA: hypothetical protein VGF02_01075 [Pseudolabrys sp.]
MQVRRRLVVFVQGYDARSIAENFQDFRREYRLTCEHEGLTGEVGAIKETPKEFSASWDVTTRGDGWQVETRYRLLRWNDLVQKDFARPAWWKIVQMYRTIGVAMLNGAFMRMLHLNWRVALMSVVPILLITTWVLFGTFIGILCMGLVARLGAPELVARFVGIVTGLGSFSSLLWLTEPLTGLLKRCDQAASIDEFINGKRKDWNQRLDVFAAELADVADDSKADEMLIVGHGLGAMLSINLVGRALTRDAGLGDHGPRVALLTLGASFPAVGFNPEAKGFRNRLRQLAEATKLDWVDVQSRDDLRSFAPFDPIAGHDIVLDPVPRNPHVVEIRLRPWHKAHARFLMANAQPGMIYDYYLICCGPSGLITRMTKP